MPISDVARYYANAGSETIIRSGAVVRADVVVKVTGASGRPHESVRFRGDDVIELPGGRLLNWPAASGTLARLEDIISEGGGESSAFEQSFTGVSSVVCVHNFGSRPLVQVIDDGDDEFIPFRIHHDSANQFTVFFSSSRTGTVLANYGGGSTGTGPADTDDLPEGSVNLYFTDGRADARIAAAVGVSVQAYSAGLTSLGGLPTVADRIAYSTAADTWAETAISAFGRSLIDDADAAAARTTLGLVIGTDVQAHSAILDATTASFTTAQETKLGHITVTQAVDLDQIESRVNDLDAAVVLKGTWDASAGTFPGGGVAQAGWSYVVSVAGVVDGIDAKVGDRLLALVDNASTATYAANWLHLDYTDRVSTVFGRVGAVVAATNDYTWAQIDKTSSSLADITTRSAADLSSGLLALARGGANADLSGVTALRLIRMNAGGTALEDAGVAVSGLQASDPFLTSIAALGTAADKMIYTTGVDTAAETALSAAARTILDDATVADIVATLGGAAATGTVGTGLVYKTSPSFTTQITTPKVVMNAGGGANDVHIRALAGGDMRFLVSATDVWDITASGNFAPATAGGFSIGQASRGVQGVYFDEAGAGVQTARIVAPTLAADIVLTLPAATGTFATLDGTEIFTNKTLGSPVISVGAFGSGGEINIYGATGTATRLQVSDTLDAAAFYDTAGTLFFTLAGAAASVPIGFATLGSGTWTETSTTPTDPTSGTQMRVYMKADKFVIQFNDGGTVRYKYLDLTGTGVTWTHSTTGP